MLDPPACPAPPAPPACPAPPRLLHLVCPTRLPRPASLPVSGCLPHRRALSGAMRLVPASGFRGMRRIALVGPACFGVSAASAGSIRGDAAGARVWVSGYAPHHRKRLLSCPPRRCAPAPAPAPATASSRHWPHPGCGAAAALWWHQWERHPEGRGPDPRGKRGRIRLTMRDNGPRNLTRGPFVGKGCTREAEHHYRTWLARSELTSPASARAPRMPPGTRGFFMA
jgi:hypothetical protein